MKNTKKIKKTFIKNIFYVISIITLVITFFVGFKIGANNIKISSNDIFSVNSTAKTEKDIDFTVFWNVWNTINQKFRSASTTKKFSVKEKIWGATAGLASSLDDPYTVFFPPEDAEIFQENISGNFSGVGMRIDMKDGELVVISPLKKSPAEKAGILAEDKVIAVDGKSISGIRLDEAVKKIRGKAGTPVVLTIVHKGAEESLDIEIIRGNIEIPVIKTKLREDGVFVIELYSFSAISPNLFREAIQEFIDSSSNKLILDLRGNPGGYLEAAIDMASWFLPKGEVVVTEDFGEENKEKTKIHRSKGYDVFNENLKFAILIDAGSASASEILAGALQEHGEAILVGTNTFGKGSVQELVTVDNEGSSLKITVAQWLTPNGKSISDGGLTPDYIVEYTREDRKAERDPQLDKAVELLTK